MWNTSDIHESMCRGAHALLIATKIQTNLLPANSPKQFVCLIGIKCAFSDLSEHACG